MNIINRAKVYLRKKDIEKANKDKKELVKNITNTFLKDKTTIETIYLITEVTKAVNLRLDSDLDDKLKDVEAISNYSCEKRT